MKTVIAPLLVLALSATGAHAIVGGREEHGPLSHRSVMVLSSKGGVCSAVVVAPDVVMTAAHCVTDAPEHRVHFRDGAGEPVLIAPAAVAVHPGYVAKAIAQRRPSVDLALVRLPAPLPSGFESATLGLRQPRLDETVTVGGYGLSREGAPKTTGTFRSAALTVIEPYGQSRILLWLKGSGAMGACQGDSGGPMEAGGAVIATASWSSPAKGRGCGGITQGILLGPQRGWIDRTMQVWQRTVRWNE